jgi:hypothetical protein
MTVQKTRPRRSRQMGAGVLDPEIASFPAAPGC